VWADNPPYLAQSGGEWVYKPEYQPTNANDGGFSRSLTGR